MDSKSFIETIKVIDGQFWNLNVHIARMQSTILHFYNKQIQFSIKDFLIPQEADKGLFKCRIVYASDIVSIEFVAYSFKKIDSLALIECNDIDYSYKLVDRSHLEELYRQRKTASDVLIVKNGCITDASYANVVFENEEGLFTPDSYLLNGTKRQLLISQHKIKERKIRVADLPTYRKMYLINAMIDINDDISIPVSNIYPLED